MAGVLPQDRVAPRSPGNGPRGLGPGYVNLIEVKLATMGGGKLSTCPRSFSAVQFCAFTFMRGATMIPQARLFMRR
jgi:hypothetical protein